MNKKIIYIGLAAIVGFGIGYIVFGNSTKEDGNDHQKEDHSNEMWTCSMHPQIMKTEPGDCPICGMDLIPAKTGKGELAANQFKMTANAMALANIQTTIIEDQAAGENTISLSGKIIENEEANAIQASYFDGRIEQLSINYKGQKISKGQKLATIYAPALVAAQQELITATALKESQPALYTAVRNKLKLWKLSDAQIDAIEKSGKAREYFTIYATISGTVSELLSAEGDYVKQGQPLLKVNNLNTVWAEFDVYENQISQFKKGQKVTVKTKAYLNKNFEATISFINPVLDNATRTIPVRVVLKNKDNLFKPGMFVTGAVQGIQETSKLLSIPSSAVMWTGKRSVVYLRVHTEPPVFEMREVTLGTKRGDQYEILEGLHNGDEIVTHGTFTVDAAAQLQGKSSMMNQNNTNKKVQTDQKPDIELSMSLQKGLIKMIPDYLSMKDAFVESDASQVIRYAQEMVNSMTAIIASENKQTEKKYFSKSLEMLHAIIKQEHIENQRAHFVVLNEEIVTLVSGLNALDAPIYIQKCPMANSNKGAIWISAQKEIRNPYYGDAMLTCGSVINTID